MCAGRSAVVHNDDLVPRLSDANCGRLAIEIVADDALYKERFAKDRAAYYEYFKTLGKTQAMSHGEGEAVGGGAEEKEGGAVAEVDGEGKHLTVRPHEISA